MSASPFRCFSGKPSTFRIAVVLIRDCDGCVTSVLTEALNFDAVILPACCLNQVLESDWHPGRSLAGHLLNSAAMTGRVLRFSSDRIVSPGSGTIDGASGVASD